MQQFRDGAARDIVVNVHYFVESMDFKDMIYTESARLDAPKYCLPCTHENILSEITNWIYSSGEDVQRVFWLSSTAGKGKSAIAHTIADWYSAHVAFCCFDHARGAEQRYEKIFATIARDVVDRDPVMRRTVADVIRSNNEHRHTTDVMRLASRRPGIRVVFPLSIYSHSLSIRLAQYLSTISIPADRPPRRCAPSSFGNHLALVDVP